MEFTITCNLIYTLELNIGLFALYHLYKVLEEIIRRSAGDMRLTTSRSRVKLKEGVFKMFINLHDSSLVTTAITVVRSREDCHNILFMAPIVTIHNKLMRTSDQCKAVGVRKALGDILTKGITGTTRGDTPARTVIRIRPKKITNRAFVRYFLQTVLLHDVGQHVN